MMTRFIITRVIRSLCDIGRIRPPAAALFFASLTLAVVTAHGQKLYIFMPTEYSAVEIEKRFIEKYSRLTVRVFGSVTDFRKSVVDDKPDAVISKPQLVERLEGYTGSLHATVNGSTEEKYLLLSVEKPVKVADIDGKAVGVLDFLGKREIDSLVAVMTGVRPLLTKVKKMADLLPLLTMNMVDAVIVSTSQAAYLKQRSKMNFVENPCNCSGGVAVLATLRSEGELEKSVKTMPSELARMIGIDGWK